MYFLEGVKEAAIEDIAIEIELLLLSFICVLYTLIMKRKRGSSFSDSVIRPLNLMKDLKVKKSANKEKEMNIVEAIKLR